MSQNNNSIPSLSVGELLKGDTLYRIPMYQRNYAWGEAEIIQLIQDVADYLTKEGSNYYIGTLVVYERKENGKTIHEVIDGQQRLTTLALLVSYLKHRPREDDTDLPEDSTGLPTSLNIDFECREHSTGTLKSLFDKGKVDSTEKVNEDIGKGYGIIEEGVNKVLKEHKEYTDHEETLRKFKECLLERVLIIPVPVPEGTDLNHYFEIMNTRGEQLEEHEVLKAKMMEKLNKDEQDTFQTIWEACANMDKYVQMSIPSDLRKKDFGGDDCSSFEWKDFACLNEALKEEPKAGQENNSDHKKSLSEIIGIQGPISKKESNGNSSNDDKERFSSVINFPNFLLQVLRVVYPEADVSLDDKKLIDMFNEHVLKQNTAANSTEEVAEKIRSFAFELLQCRYLFDRYVPKQERLTEGTSWFLKKFKKGENGSGYYVNTFSKVQNDAEDDTSLDGDKVLLLLSAFHVSAPSQSYKHWLTATLHWLRKEYIRKEQQKDKGDIDGKAYLEQLETIARAFVFDRFLAVGGEAPREYSNMIDVENCDSTSFDHEKLRYTNITNNFVFNFLDYLLWCDKGKGDSSRHNLWENAENKELVESFRFTFRSSVEHYYPQNPVGEYADKQKPENIDSFGNLCLISHSQNSRLSNLWPEAKKGHYKGKGSIDSIKQYLMMQKENWEKKEIEEHEKEMVKVLEDSLRES